MEDALARGVEGSYEVVLGAMELAPTLGLTFDGDEKSLLNLFLVIEEDQLCIEGASASNTKGKRELKNLECSIKFEARGCGSSRAEGRVVRLTF
jgi:hypothetical protein